MSPRRSREFVLFTHGTYSRRQLQFYKRLVVNRTTVAVDGGLRFFRLIGHQPDILLGDFDSIRKPRNLPASVEVIEYPTRKDKTDTHLAVELCVERGASAICIVIPSLGEPDHLLGTILLPFLNAVKGARIRLVNYHFEIVPLIDSSHVFVDAARDMVSVVPISERGRLTCTGVQYPVKNAALRLGDTLSLRNRIVARRARFDVTGKAMLVRNHSRHEGPDRS